MSSFTALPAADKRKQQQQQRQKAYIIIQYICRNQQSSSSPSIASQPTSSGRKRRRRRLKGVKGVNMYATWLRTRMFLILYLPCNRLNLLCIYSIPGLSLSPGAAASHLKGNDLSLSADRRMFYSNLRKIFPLPSSSPRSPTLPRKQIYFIK